MNSVLNMYNKCRKLPFGNRIFSTLACINAPYFGSIKPVYQELTPGHCEITMKNRRSVRNHIKSVHAIAMCNICELAAGTMLEVSIPSHLRWIPKGMNVDYLKVAKTDLKAICKLQDIDWDTTTDLPITVDVKDTNGVSVVRAVINMHISKKK